MPEADNGFFEESILYSHFRIIFNLTTVFVSLFYYDTTLMETAYNFKYIPKYLTDDFLFAKTYFKTDRKFVLDLPKSSNLQFITNKLVIMMKIKIFL
jgi:hypothetical protein